MSIKRLFDKGKTSKVVSSTDLEKLSKDIESSENMEQRFRDIDRFVPPVNFENPENFARFASAEKYYTDAMDRVVRYYPYDGSEAELNLFHNESNYIDKYLFDNLYPRTTGYAKFGRWGDTDTSPIAANLYYGEPTAKEYIEVKGGPHTASYGMPSGSLGSTFTGSNYYSTDIYNQAGKSPEGRDGSRESNLRMSLDDGITIEFWLKKESFIASKTQKEVIFDLWNQVTSSDSRHGRLTVELTASGFAEDGANPFRFTFVSGAVAGKDNAQYGAGFQDLPLGGTTITTASVADNKWHHYALSVSKTGSNNTVKFYRDGQIVTTIATGSTTGEITGSLIGFIGALQTHPNLPFGTTIPADGMTGWGKLSGSIDEFRYWKVRRTGEEIKKNYYAQVRGGTNTDTANTELGVYYKFNEGITGDSALDSIVLDYSGRISNGIWVGYAAGSRSTGSAIIEYSGSNKVEYRDPILYPSHPDVVSLRSGLVASASYHDIRNSSAIYHSLPTWIIEEDDENAGQLKNLTQMIGNYFDTLYLQIEAMKDLHVPTYQTSSAKALPFANRLLESKGFINSEIFANAEVLEAVMNRDTEREFSDDLHNVKNLIYQNIYNNLVHIFKTKGTEKSFQSLIRSFGVDEELIRINLYADNTTQLLRDNFRPKAVKKNFVDFYQSDNQDAVVTHQTSSQVGTDISSVASTATITVADGDAASGMTEKEHITLRSTDGTIKRYVITNAASDGSTATGTALSDSGNTDTGAGTAGAAEDGGVAVSINLSSATQNAFLVQLKAAIEHAAGHNGKITVSAVPSPADGAQSITLTQSAVGAIGNTTTETDIDQLTAGNFTGGQNNPDSIGVTYISASHRDISTTAESEVIFPRFKQPGDIGYTEVAFTDSSIFGWDQADPDPDDYIKPSGGSGYQVLAIRPTNESKDAYFKLVDRANDTTIATSSLYKDVYDDQRWTFALRTRNVMTSSITPTDPATSHGMGTFLTGAIEGTATATVTVVGGTAANGMTEKESMTITSVDGTTRVYVIVDDAATTVATGDALTTTSDTGANQAGTLALRANIIDLAGAQSNNDRFKVNVPVALGGTGNDITIRVVAPADPSDGTANEIQVGLGSVVTTRNRVVLAINGLDSSVVQYGSGAGDVTNGIAGITAAAGTGDGDITITATVAGTAGDSITFTDIAGTAIASGDTGASPATLAGGAEVTANSVAVAINTTTGGGATLSTQHAFLVQLKAAIEGSTGHNGEITVSAVAPINSDAQTITLTEAYSGPSGAQTITDDISQTTVSGFTSLENGTHVEVSLYGVHTAYDRIQEEFALSGNAIHSDITVPRRYYVGARRTNVTGTVNEKSSVKVGYLRHWQMYLDNKVVQAHARDTENYGTRNPMRPAYLLETPLTGVWMPEVSALALNWDFSNVTGSDPSGEFVVQDFSSGSLLKRRFRDPDIDPIVNNQYNGRGYFFKTNTTAAVDTNYISSARYQLPEVMTSRDMIEIRNQDDLVFTKESRPISHYFAFEKSMYQTISEEMLNMFAGITEFNNLIGEPVNRYRHEYKDMSKLRQIFYERVENTPDLDKYLSYYKWLDTALGEMLQQLVPASSRFSDDIRNVIEDTVLTRNKYRHILPTLRTPSTEVEGQIKGIHEHIYNWRIGHAPMNNKGTKVVHPQPQNQNCLWWRHRAERMGASITSDTAPVDRSAAQVSIIDEQRELYKRKGYSFVSASVPQFTTLPGTPATYTLIVADGDAASGMTEKEHITLISTDGTTKRYVITNAASDGTTDTGTILVDADNTDTGGSTAGSDEDGGIAVSINLSSATQNAFLVALKTAVEHPNGHNGKILVSSVPVQADGEQLITLTQSVHGAPGNTSVTTSISQITAANFINGTDHPTKVGVNNIPIYTGSYYPNNRFSRVYRLFVGLGFNSTSILGAWNGQLQAGSNPTTGPNTKYTYWRNSTDSSDITKLIEVTNIIDHSGCEDEDKLPIAGTFPSRNAPPDRAKILMATSTASPAGKANNIPFSLYKSDITTGYKSSISNVNIALNTGVTTAGGLELNNLHQDVIETGEASMQGPFTEKYVGGLPHRHVDLNTSLDNPTNRVEGFVIVPAADSIQVRAPSAASDDRAAVAPEVRADHYRNVKVKRPVNIENIQQLTGSGQLNRIGNFTTFRDIVQISDRDTNNRAFVKHEGKGPFLENSKKVRKDRANPNNLANGNIMHRLGEFKDVAKPNFYISGSSHRENNIVELGANQFAQNNRTDYVIIERFSAPGGPETAGDSMGGAALDFGSAQYSPYNNLNYRNLSVRLPLRRLLTDHANQFGYRSDERHRATPIHSPSTATDSYSGQNTLATATITVADGDAVSGMTEGEKVTITSATGTTRVYRICEDNTTTIDSGGALVDGSDTGAGTTADDGDVAVAIGIATATAATAAFTFTDKPNEATTITLTDYEGTSLVFEVDNDGDGGAGSNIEMDPSTNNAAGMSAVLISVVNASALKITASTGGGATGEVLLTQDATVFAGNTTITLSNYSNWNANTSATFPTAFTGGLTADTQNAFLVQLKAAIESDSGHNGSITVGAVPTEANGAQAITLTQTVAGPEGNTTITDDISQTTVASFTGGTATLPAFHNVNRNSRLRYENSSSRTTAETVIRAQTHDNYYVQREIPQSDTQYAWITASLTHIPGHQTTVLGHPHPDGTVSSSVAFNYGLAQGPITAIASTGKTVGPGFIPALNFVSASDVVSRVAANARGWLGPGGNISHATATGADKRGVNATYPNGFYPTDFAGMNGNVRQIIDTGSLILSGAGSPYHNGLGQIGTAPFYEASLLYLNTVFGSDTGEFLNPATQANGANVTVLNALNLNRNGPYGYPSWKQIRTGETRIGRYLKRNNIISYNETPGRHIVIEDKGRGRQEVIERFGKLRQFREPPVVSRYKPAKFTLGMEQVYQDQGAEVTATRPIEIKASYGNELSFFSNLELNTAKGFVKSTPIGYKTISNFYLRGGLTSPSTPAKSFIGFSYGETLYPREENTYMAKARARNTFANNFWKDKLSDRLILGQTKTRFNGTTPDDIDASSGEAFVGKQLKQSSWNLDGLSLGQMLTASTEPIYLLTGSETGMLQLRSSMIHYGNKQSMTASVLYARPHMLETTSSLRSFTGPNIAETGSTSMILAGKPMGRAKIYGGITSWEAGDQAGIVNDDGEFVNRPTTPFYNSYEDYAEDLRVIAKDYSIVPEFRISEHIDFYVKQKQGDFLAKNPKLLSIFGSPTGSTVPQNSSENEFFKVYSNSDFMRHFASVKNEHKEIANPSEITLTCKAAMKFLPYNGFYPSERTVDIATQFSKSYGTFMTFGGDDSAFSEAKIRPMIAPLFAPGVLYNTIKSGIAVDYPIYTSSFIRHDPRDTSGNATTNYTMIATASSPRRDRGGKISGWDFRVPFESLVEPEKYLTNLSMVDMECHASSAMDMTASWSGQGDNLYKMMSNNFLASVPEFFLPSGELTTLKSKPQKQFKSLDTGSVYGLRVKIRKSYNKGRQKNRIDSYLVPNDTLPDSRSTTAGIPSLRETFTMYSRPTAFGPPVSGRYTNIGGTNAERVNVADSLMGINPSFTPPYYDGEAWCDVLFHPSSSFATLGDILAESKKLYWRFDKLGLGNVSNNLHPYGNVNINKFAMQLSSSFNLFQSIKEPTVEYDKDGNIISVGAPEDDNSVWVMQPKFETPMYNFADTGIHPITNAAGNLIVPTNNSESCTRGMWHQFGVIPTDPSKGIFLEIDDIPENFLRNRVPAYVSSSAYDSDHAHDQNSARFNDTNYRGFYGGTGPSKKPFRSLLDIVQFDEKTVKLGKTAEKVRASEAIVAVPFIEVAGKRKFFNIDKSMVNKVIQDPNTEEVGDSIKQIVHNLDKFVVPPSMDFLAFKGKVDPIAMYFFEFEFEFDQDDLTHMWQNLMPPSGKIVKKSEVKVSHKLLLNEVFGNVGDITGEVIDNELKWMVFKVKQRANMNYFSKVAGSDADADPRYRTKFKAGRTGESENASAKFGFNWPFDFFSMVEMIKLESEIKFAPQEEDVDSALVIGTERDILNAGVTTLTTTRTTGPTTVAPTTSVATTSQPQTTATTNQIISTNQIKEY